MSVYIIAEAGVNHNGSLELALKLVDKAKAAGADCVKFQTFKTENLVSGKARLADYQQKTMAPGASQYDMLRRLELGYGDFKTIRAHCCDSGIAFLSTPFDLESIEFLHELGVPFWKVPSGEITNLPYLEAIGKTEKPVVMSTGMSTLEEIGDAISVLRAAGTPTLSLLHCNTEYPTPFCDVNLRAMDTLASHFGVPVGYSDHTEGIEVSVAAAAKGATVLEKHFTLDKTMEGPDHRASLEPKELSALVRAVRNVSVSLGTGEKRPSPSETKNIAIARKSILAGCRIQAGEAFTPDNLAVKRPGSGISPMRWYEVLGKPAPRDFQKDELIEL